MRGSIRTRLGFWLERFTILHVLLFVPDGPYAATDMGTRCVNRINGHLVMRKTKTEGN